jgi:hypothetical protein
MRRREVVDPHLGEYWVEYEPANLVDWAGLRLPELFTACFAEERFRVRMEIVLEESGPECIAISRLDLESPALTSERRFPIRTMVNAAVRAASFELVEVPVERVRPRSDEARLVPDERGQVRLYRPAFDDRGRARKRAAPRTSGREPDLQDVVALYRRAVAEGSAPSAAIAAALGITRAAARKRVQRARERGLLAPARGRRAGEAARPARARRTK